LNDYMAYRPQIDLNGGTFHAPASNDFLIEALQPFGPTVRVERTLLNDDVIVEHLPALIAVDSV
jgi:hypothetical protein